MSSFDPATPLSPASPQTPSGAVADTLPVPVLRQGGSGLLQSAATLTMTCPEFLQLADAASARIEQTWLRFVAPVEARKQAEAFRARLAFITPTVTLSAEQAEALRQTGLYGLKRGGAGWFARDKRRCFGPRTIVALIRLGLIYQPQSRVARVTAAGRQVLAMQIMGRNAGEIRQQSTQEQK